MLKLGYAVLFVANAACVVAGIHIFQREFYASASVRSDDPEMVRLEQRANALYDMQFADAVIESARPTPRPQTSPRPSIRPVTMPVNAMSGLSEDVICLAINLHHEARGESELGRVMVGQVTLNRTKHKYLGAKTVCETVFKRKQFSWTLDRPYIDMSKPAERKAFQESMVLAMALLNGQIKDRSRGAMHYYAILGMKDKKEPYWSSSYEQVAEVGGHRFLK